MAFYKLGTREGGVNPTGNAVEANVLKNKTFSNASGINKIGTMPDNSTTTSNGTVPGINSSYPNVPIRPGSNLQMGVNTDGVKQLAIEPPQGYYPGGGSSYIGVDADDLGDAVASDVVSGKTFTSESGIEVIGTRENSGTYTASSRNAALDMGNPNTYRYVDTTGVPNSNSGTYTFPANDTGGTKDLGETNTYRYVNAANVYNKGKADGQASLDSLIWNYTATNSSNGSSVWATAQYYSIPNSSIIYNSVSTSNSLRTYKFKVTKAKKVHIYCSGNNGSTYNWHSGTPFFDIWNERIGTHYTSGTYTPNSQATKEMDMSCEKDDIICIKYWYGTYQYGTCKVGITLYG